MIQCASPSLTYHILVADIEHANFIHKDVSQWLRTYYVPLAVKDWVSWCNTSFRPPPKALLNC